MNYIGTFEVTSKSVRATDPCYSPGTWCQGLIKGVRNGAWKAFDEYDSGAVGELRIVAEGFEPRDSEWMELYDIDFGVDSGMFGFFDGRKYAKNWDDECVKGAFYQTCIDNCQGIIRGFGVNSSSGYGDGSYPVYIQKDINGEITAFKVLFLYDEDDDE